MNELDALLLHEFQANNYIVHFMNAHHGGLAHQAGNGVACEG